MGVLDIDKYSIRDEPLGRHPQPLVPLGTPVKQACEEPHHRRDGTLLRSEPHTVVAVYCR